MLYSFLAMKPGDQQGNERQTIIFRVLGLGVQIVALAVVSVLANLFLGLWIDRKLGTSLWAKHWLCWAEGR